MRFILACLLLAAQSCLAQSPTRVEIKDSTARHHILNYIWEAKSLQLVSASAGIIVFQKNTLQDGYEFLLSTIDKERSSYFRRIVIPSQYTFIEGVLVLIQTGHERDLAFPEAYHKAVDKLVNGRFKRLEEDKSFYVTYHKAADGTVHRLRSMSGGNLHNDVQIRIYADGKTKLWRPI